MITEFISCSTNFTQKLGAKLATEIKIPSVFILTGELGSGKTEFVRGFIKGAKGDENSVRSPTFNLWISYETPNFTVHHLDLYRIAELEQIYELGFLELFNTEKTVFFVEWGEKILEAMQEQPCVIEFQHISVKKRKIIFRNLPKNINL